MQRVVIWAASAVVDENKLRQQVDLGEAWALSQKAQIINTLHAAGIGRVTPDLSRLLHIALQHHVTAYQELLALVSLRQFDVLWVEELHRLSRSPNALFELIKRVALSGASLYIHQTGQWVDLDNYKPLVLLADKVKKD